MGGRVAILDVFNKININLVRRLAKTVSNIP